MNREVSNCAQLNKLGSTIPQTFQAEHRKIIRQEELSQIIPLMHSRLGGTVLEIGAGAGWQAKVLAALGFDVTAIDIESSNYNSIREWPVLEYDGSNINLPSESMDVVFSSNVLEHVPHIEEFQKEMQRVLKSDGIAIHVMPTATWRIATIFTFYLVRAAQLIGLRKSSKRSIAKVNENKTEKKRSRGLRDMVVPSLHGVRGNIVTESYYFSELYWRNVFLKSGWIVEKVQSNKLFYSGNRLFGKSLPLSFRKVISNLLGGSCKIYLLRKTDDKAATQNRVIH